LDNLLSRDKYLDLQNLDALKGMWLLVRGWKWEVESGRWDNG
jgi:hypothetical protein